MLCVCVWGETLPHSIHNLAVVLSCFAPWQRAKNELHLVEHNSRALVDHSSVGQRSHPPTLPDRVGEKKPVHSPVEPRDWWYSRSISVTRASPATGEASHTFKISTDMKRSESEGKDWPNIYNISVWWMLFGFKCFFFLKRVFHKTSKKNFLSNSKRNIMV